MMRTAGGGTVIPIDKMNNLCNDSSNCVIIIITDTSIFNWEELTYFCEKEIKNHPMMMFCIGEQNILEDKNIQNIISIGMEIYAVDNVTDLPDLVIGRSQRYW